MPAFSPSVLAQLPVTAGFCLLTNPNSRSYLGSWLATSVDGRLIVIFGAGLILEGVIIAWLLLKSRSLIKRAPPSQQGGQKFETSYRALLNAANDAIFVHDPKTGEIVDANKRACEMYGWTIAEIRKLRVGDLSAADSLHTNEKALALLEKEASGGGPDLFEWRAKDKDGRLLYHSI